MSKRIVLVTAFVFVLLTAYSFGRWERGTVRAQGHQYIQKSFGHCVGSYVNSAGTPMLIFEDASGVIRFVDGRTGNAITVFDRL